MGDGPKTNSQTDGVTQTVAEGAETTTTLPTDNTPPLYMAIAESCGDVGPAHLTDCSEKNCWTKMAEEYEEEGAAEDDAPRYMASAPREIVREVRLGRLLCSILRFRAKTNGTPHER